MAVITEKQRAKITKVFEQYAKRSRNAYALGHYCKALANLDFYLANGHDFRLSILNSFLGKLGDRILTICGFEKRTKDEHMVGGFEKLPNIWDCDKCGKTFGPCTCER